MEYQVKTYFFNFCRSLFKIRWLENILVKTTVGKNPFTAHSKLVPNYYQYKTGTFRKIKRNGIRFELDISNFYDWYVYFGFADDWLENMISFLSPGDVAIDVGVNNGKSLLRIAKAVGKTGKVYGFEPAEANFYKANRNISINGLKNIILHKMALGFGNGKAYLNFPDKDNPGLNYFSSLNNQDKTLQAFDIIELDSVLKEKKHDDVSLIHLDVEGFETNVLKGAVSTIWKYMPVIFLKISNEKLARSGSSNKELLNLLLSLNYNIFDADTEVELSIEEIMTLDEAAVYCLPKPKEE